MMNDIPVGAIAILILCAVCAGFVAGAEFVRAFG